MAKFSLDMKHFKKVGGDENSTVLRHSNGHEMKVIHKALSPEHQEIFKSLPMSEKKPQYAEGTGDVEAPQMQAEQQAATPPPSIPINTGAPDMSGAKENAAPGSAQQPITPASP